MQKEVKSEQVVFEWKIIQVVQKLVECDGVQQLFEKARRSPGVRMIYHDERNKKIMLTKEYRYELDAEDYRLPWGKVTDTLTEFLKIEKDEIEKYAAHACIREGLEETWLEPTIATLLWVSHAGTTIERDLYYFVCTERKEKEQNMWVGEHITVGWYEYHEVLDMLQKHQISEDRSRARVREYMGHNWLQ